MASAASALRARRRRIESRVERRFPALYDARHAAHEIGRALWPLIGPLLALVLAVPFALLILGLDALFDFDAPSVDLPDVDLPSVPVPGWLEAVGDALAAALDFLADVGRYVLIAVAVALGIGQTIRARRRRAEAEAIGREELLGRLARVMRRMEPAARDGDRDAQDGT